MVLPNEAPALFLVCGKIASGKTTQAQKLAEETGRILIAEDAWLSGLYPEEIHSIPDYVKYAHRFRGQMEGHIIDLLKAGLSVVLNFPANTPEIRSWMREIAERAETRHELHCLDVEDEVCKQRMIRRNEAGGHEFAPSPEQFDVITSYFVPPSAAEGLVVKVHRQ
ncbi:AAA family ATPase [Aestuariispira insulae]|uniref:Putative kinase n=1 Tax=Aestuariispira insulae TaxID=1461337 RepID=A0A3D9HKF5_9PROT|nr:ATP-binding protein [Aestuariispira insulae]RED49954.1 putative kinase [Aestuariispira insulae]